jgi:hypothetical protein
VPATGRQENLTLDQITLISRLLETQKGAIVHDYTIRGEPGISETATLSYSLPLTEEENHQALLRMSGVPAPDPNVTSPVWKITLQTYKVARLLGLVPDLRTGPAAVRRLHPVILAAIARHVLTGAVNGARDGYRTARTELGEAVPPHVVDAALTAYRDLGRQMARDAKAAELVERAARRGPIAGRRLSPKS